MRRVCLNTIKVVAFIVVVFAFIFVPVWFHEQGHISEAKKQGINFYFRSNGVTLGTLLMKIPIGEAVSLSAKDCERFNSLSMIDKEKITHAGVMPGIIAFTVLWSIPIFLFAYYRNKTMKKSLIIYLLVYVVLYLVYVIWTLWLNVYSQNPLNDWHFVNILDCSRFG